LDVKDTDRSRRDPTLASSMLEVCGAPGCSTIVFGGGTCVEHDRPTDSRLEDEGEMALQAGGALPRREESA